jgi:hypothetical protein
MPSVPGVSGEANSTSTQRSAGVGAELEVSLLAKPEPLLLL